MQLQIEPAGKILGRSVTFGPKSVENSSDLDNFFELMTPNAEIIGLSFSSHLFFVVGCTNIVTLGRKSFARKKD